MHSSVRRILRTTLIAAATLVLTTALASPARADGGNPTPTLITDCFGNLLIVPPSPDWNLSSLFAIYASSGSPTTAGGYVVQGTAGNDVIIGSAGPDYIYGNGGDDTICGGDGDDHLYGGSLASGDSTGTDYDHIDGENGDDEIHGGPDTDVIYAGHGDDLVLGDDGADIIHGQGGSDALFGNDGADFIQCGQDFDSGKNPYYQPTPGWVMTGDFADGGGDTDVLPESVGLVSDCEHTMNIP